MNKINFFKSSKTLGEFLNIWWLFLSIWGLVNTTIWAPEIYFYPIGTLLFLISGITFFLKKELNKKTFAFAIILIIFTGLARYWQSTSSIYVFYLSLSIFLYYNSPKLSKNHLIFSIGIIPVLCDIVAGLNKLLPNSGFHSGEILKYVLANNLINEPQFIYDILINNSGTIATLEIICGLIIFFNSFYGLIFSCLMHIPIAIFSGETIGHIIHLILYAAAIPYCVLLPLLYLKKENGEGISLFNYAFLNIKKFFNIKDSFSREYLSPLIALIIFQISLPTGLLAIRILTNKIIMYGFGWQMYSQPTLFN